MIKPGSDHKNTITTTTNDNDNDNNNNDNNNYDNENENDNDNSAYLFATNFRCLFLSNDENIKLLADA